MLIDCDSCTARGAACAGCPVTVLLGITRPESCLTAAEQQAIEAFHRAGFTTELLTAPAPRRRTTRRATRPRRVA